MLARRGLADYASQLGASSPSYLYLVVYGASNGEVIELAKQ